MIQNSQKGSSLIEAVVALSAVLVTIVGVSILVATSISNSEFIANQNAANKYAQEGIEHLRSIKNTNYDAFIDEYDDGGQHCLPADFIPTLPSQKESCPRLNDTFIRTVLLEDTNSCGTSPGDLEKQVTVTVYWQSGKCNTSSASSFCHSSEVVTCLNKTEFDLP